MPNPLRVLIVEDNANDVELLVRELRRSGFAPDFSCAQTEEEYLARLDPSLDIILSDYFLPRFCQEKALALLKERGWDIPFIITSHAIGEERAVLALKEGAFDWIPKGHLDRLGASIRHALQQKQFRQQRQAIQTREQLFTSLGQRLSHAATPIAAAHVITEITDELFGWDACTFDSYCADRDCVEPVLTVDTVDGSRQDVPPNATLATPTPRARAAIESGGQLILRQTPCTIPPGCVPFGDTTRASASIMFVPVRHAGEVVGFLSIQSYTVNAYTPDDLKTFQALADFCGGALERIHTEETLRKSEERYRSLVSATSQMVWSMAGDGQVVEDSATWRGYTGQTWEQFRGWGWIGALHSDDVDLTLELWKGALLAKSIFQHEFRVHAADGNYRYFAVRGAPVIEGNGTIREWVATCSDITDKRRAELRNQAFFELAQQLNSARSPEQAARDIVNVADTMFGWDACYLYLYSAETNTIRRLITYDTINGQKTNILRELSVQPTPAMQRVLQHGADLILRSGAISADKNMIQFGSGKPSASIMIVPIRTGSQVIGFLSIQSYATNAYDGEDVSTLQALADFCGGALERLRAEEALYDSERRFRSLIEQAADAILVYDDHGNIVDTNQRACRTLGYSQQQLLQLNMADIDVNFTRETQRNVLAETLSGEPASLESIHRRKDDSMFAAEVRVGIFEWQNQRLFLALFRDITERKQLENQLHQAQKMEAFGQIAGGVAHDFNNLLTIISGYTNLLLVNPALDHDSREQLEEVSSATEKATNLTRQLLTLSRKKEIRAEPIDLGDVVTNMMKMLKRVIGEDIQLACNYSASLPLIDADIGMMEQVLLNIAINGRDAMPKGGVLDMTTSVETITQDYLHLSAEARVGEFVCLTVRDTGCGMSPEVRARIFEPFFTTKGRKGTGLGLATVYSIVKQHRGWIDVSSEVNSGTTFKIYFPVSSEKMNGVHQKSPQPGIAGGNETILLVEDEGALRALARQILQRHGYKVLEAESGVKALAVWKEHAAKIDLLLTDMVMPEGLTGQDLAQKLLAERPELKVIYSSGYSVALETFDFELHEGWNFLPKPYHPNKLAKTVRHRLDTEECSLQKSAIA